MLSGIAKRSHLSRFGITLLLLCVFGCGGGGGGGGGNGGGTTSTGGSSGLTQPPSTPVDITATNAAKVGAVATEPAVGGTAGLLGALAGAEPAVVSKPRAATRALLSVARGTKERLNAPSTMIAVAQTTNCLVSGSFTTDASADGTSITVVFNACSDFTGETTNGSASASGVASSTNSFSATFIVDITHTETGSAPLRLAGGFSISETCNLTTNDCTETFSGTSLGASDGTDTWFITNFTITEATVSTTITTTANYTVASAALNGAVAVVTSTPLQMTTSALHPHTGVVVITGSANSKLRVTVLGSSPTAPGQVRLEVDANGDNTFETSTLLSWSELEAL